MNKKFLHFCIFLFLILFIFGGFFIGSRKKNKVNVDLIPAPTISQIHEDKSLAKVLRVVDGDTIKVLVNNKEDTLRLIGIDAPETVDPKKTVQCFGKEASNKAKEVIAGKTITLESDPTQGDRDEYGRLLRYVFLEDGTNFNELMISEGYAHEYTFKGNPYKYQSEFIQAEKKAREENKGLWGSC